MAGSSVVLGYLKYVLGFDSLAFQEGLGDADKRLKSAQRSLAKTADKFTSIGSVMSIGITAPFTALVASAIPAARESQQALGQVQAALTSMGDAAGRTLPQLQGQAKALMHLSTFDDDDIMRKVTANLLTFGNVSGEAFDRAQLAAVNLSARLGQDLQSSAIQLGKALNNPVQGLTALSRVGVSFTAQQQEQIKAMAAAGDVAGAQAIILGELERQFGGSAEAMRKATPGIESQQAWADFQETVGAIALKVLPTLSSMLASALNWFNQLSPATQTFVIGAAAVTAGLGPFTLGVGGLISAFGTLLPLLAKVAPLMVGFATVITSTVIPVIVSVSRALIGLAIAGGPLTLLIAAATAAYLVWKNWDTIGPIVGRMATAVKTWLVDKLGPVFEFVKKGVKAVTAAFDWMTDKVVRHSYVPEMVDGIGTHMARLDGNMVQVAKSATTQVAAAFEGLEAKSESTASAMATSFEDAARSISGALQSVAGAIKGGDFLDILSSVIDAGLSIATTLTTPKVAGARADGGSVSSGRSYLVGERGPELFTASRSGYIHPNRSNGSGTGAGSNVVKLQVQANDYFDVRVASVSGSIAQDAITTNNRSAARSQSRRLA